MVEVVDRPRGEQLAHRHLAQLGMAADAVEVIVADQLALPGVLLGAELLKAIDQVGQRDILVALDVGEPVERLERLPGAVLDDRSARGIQSSSSAEIR